MELVETVIRQFGETIGLPELKLDSENICSLLVNDEIDVFFQVLDFKSNVIRVNSCVGSLNDVPETLYPFMLEANFNGLGTGSAALSINLRTSEVLLTQALQADKLSAEEFADAMKQFLTYTSFWKQELVEQAKRPADAQVFSKEEGGQAPNPEMQYMVP